MFSACLTRCSSCHRSASDSPASTRASSAWAASSWARARSASISSTSTASSTRASARSCSTLKKPGPVAYSFTSVPRRMCTRVEPAFRSATRGAWRARTPISPAAPGTISISASPSKAEPSGVTRETSSVAIGCLGGRRLGLAPGGDGLHDRADHVEGLLAEVVVLAVEDLLEALDRVLELHVRPGPTRERLGDEHRLREEALDLAGALDDELVLVGELVHAEDGDDVLEVLVALEHLLHPCRGVVMLLPHDSGLKSA